LCTTFLLEFYHAATLIATGTVFGGKVKYQGMAKTYLTVEELNGELEFMRKAAYGLSPRDLRLECAKRGWHEIEPEKKGDSKNEKQND
jgi:hypothetical protein